MKRLRVADGPIIIETEKGVLLSTCITKRNKNDIVFNDGFISVVIMYIDEYVVLLGVFNNGQEAIGEPYTYIYHEF